MEINQFGFLELTERVCGEKLVEYMCEKYQGEIPAGMILISFVLLKQKKLNDKLNELNQKIKEQANAELHTERRKLNQQLIETNKFIELFSKGILEEKENHQCRFKDNLLFMQLHKLPQKLQLQILQEIHDELENKFGGNNE
jgi:hypothetical protein